MDEENLNLEIRKFLKKIGIKSHGNYRSLKILKVHP